MKQRAGSLALGLTIGAVLSLVFVAGFIAGNAFDRQQNSSVAVAGGDRDLGDFLTAYHLVTQRSYYRPFDRHHLVDVAIDAMLAATGDPHTLFLSPSDNQVASRQINGASFTGIGAIVIPLGHTLQIFAPLPHTPATRAGLEAGDLVTRIDGVPVATMRGDTAVNRIHGKAGTIVRLTLKRGRGHPFTVSVERAQIAPVTAYGRMLDHHLGYLNIMSFGDSTGTEVSDALKYVASRHARGLILDLRDNPGGFVDAAQQVVSHFVSGGVVAYEKDNRGHLTALDALNGEQRVRMPMAVLVNGGTASAAEITAGALRDRHRAIIIGSRTYGKGSMQSIYSLGDGASLRITDRLWLTPSHHSIQGVGIRPDIQVPLGENGMPLTADPQLASAEHYLLTHTRA